MRLYFLTARDFDKLSQTGLPLEWNGQVSKSQCDHDYKIFRFQSQKRLTLIIRMIPYCSKPTGKQLVI